jgi:hypothetical protein
MFVSTFGLTRKLFTQEASQESDLQDLHIQIYHTAGYHIQSQAPFSSTRKLHPSNAVKVPTIPQTKLPELVVATKEGNSRRNKNRLTERYM